MNFLEYNKPEREKRLIIVAQWTDDLQVRVCEAPRCKTLVNEVVNDTVVNPSEDCPACGRQLCGVCFGDPNATIAWKERAGLLCCQDCTQLHPEERDAILALRVQLDQF